MSKYKTRSRRSRYRTVPAPDEAIGSDPAELPAAAARLGMGGGAGALLTEGEPSNRWNSTKLMT